MHDPDSDNASRSRDGLSDFLKPQPQLFSFLITPESYLLGASLLSGVAAIPFLLLNWVAISCLLSNCAALEDESHNLGSWLVFEGLTLFFLLTSIFTGIAYFKARPDRSPPPPEVDRGSR